MPVKFRDTININDSYTFPSADGTADQAIVTDGAGNLSFSAVTDGQTVKIECKNTSGSTITKGTPVYVTGTVGTSFRVEVAPADASDSAKMPAVGVLEIDLANNGEGYAVTGGLLKNLTTDPIDSTNTTSNDTIYVKAGGGLTMTKPTGTNLIQNIGKVGRVNSSNAGSIIVSSILRTNDVPNIPQNNIWLGNSSAVATPTSHTVGNISDVTLSSLSDGQVLTWDNANSYWKNAAAAGGSSQLSVEKNILTGDGSTVTFSVSSSIVSENNTQVYIDGVYQSKDNYSTSGSNITFSTAPPNTAEIEVIHFVSVQGVVRTDTFTGDNSTVAFTVGTSIIDENNTQIYIDGVYQSKDNYTVSGSTITFSTAPPTSAAIEVVHIKAAGISTINDNQFTGDGSTVAFTLSQSVTDENNTFVFINGVYQDKSTYSIAGAALTFSTAPQNGYTIEVMQVGEISIKANALTTDNFTGDGSTVAYTLTVTPASLDAVDVYISGLRQNKSTLSLSTNTLTFSTAPPNTASIEVKTIGDINTSSVVAAQSITGGQGIDVAEPSTNNFTISNRYDVSVISTATTAQAGYVYVLTASLALTLPAGVVGDSIKISNRSATTTCTVVPDGTDKIMGSNTTLTLDTASASFELIFSGTAEGWVIIGQ
jgi:hypothetical protein